MPASSVTGKQKPVLSRPPGIPTNFSIPSPTALFCPILHLNGFKIANPTILARIPNDELESLFRGYGYKAHFLEGDDPDTMHEGMATVLEMIYQEIRNIQKKARDGNDPTRPIWPMLILTFAEGMDWS